MGYNFEKNVIDVILNTIKDNQVYLTQKENLPQLAKLGYMYEKLWYAGRISYGYDGAISKSIDENSDEYGQCEDNPKYKIEMCEPINYEIETLIYGAWGMHVGMGESFSWDEFSSIVLKNTELSDLDMLAIKQDKTFDEWVKYLMHERYEYRSLYNTRKQVLDHLLCVIGNGYGYRNGYIIYEACGTDNDTADYGDWENAKFKPEIDLIVNSIMNTPEVKMAVDTEYEIIEEYNRKRKEEENKKWLDLFEHIDSKDLKDKYGDDIYVDGSLNIEILLSNMRKRFDLKDKNNTDYHEYYPISENYSIITFFDENTHPSYIDAGIEVCEDILNHESEEREDNIKFAKSFLEKFKK